jgi:uncharacterized protein Yka (UPF0111/DUF47 family)
MSLEKQPLMGRTEKVMVLLTEHSKMATSAVALLSKCIQSSIDDRRKLQRDLDLLKQKEAETNSLKRQIVEELIRGKLSSEERVGLMRLVRQVDWIADCSNGAGRALILFDLLQMPKQTQDIAREMSSALVECATKVAECVQRLMDEEPGESLRAADEVELLKEKVDKIYQNARRTITGIQTSDNQVGSIILLTQFLAGIEHAANACEYTCDQVRTMAVMFSKRKD